MIREVTLHTVIGRPDKATIIIDREGLKVKDKSDVYLKDSEICRRYLVQLLDMDTWKHSWHLNTERLILKDSDERKVARSILKDKIKEREEEICKLKEGIQTLGRYSIYMD